MPTSKRTVKTISAVAAESPTSRQTRSRTKELIRAFESLDIEHADKLIFDRGFDPSVISPRILARSLRHAVKKQNAPLVRELLKHEPELRTIDGEVPMLMIAVRQSNAEIAAMLIDAGVDVTETDYLHAVALCRDPKMHELAARLMEREVDLEARDCNDKSVLYYAVENEATGIVEELLRRGAKIRDDDKIVLDMAANSTRAAEMLRLLFDYGAVDVETRDKLALTAICNLIEHEPDRVDEVKTLLDLGVPVDQTDNVGVSTLHFAVSLKRTEMVQLLLTYGADVNKKSNRGTTPLMLASALCDSTIAVRLIKRGANIHDCNNSCRYPIHIACDQGRSENIRLLLALGVDVDVVDQLDFTPLSLLRDSSSEKTDIFLKHFAQLTANGVSFNSTDLATIQNDGYMSTVYEVCLKELQRMKETEFMSGVSYFDLINGKIERLTLLTKNPEFVERFHKYQENASGMSFRWLKYNRELNVAFQMAEKRRDMLIAKEELVQDAFGDVLPQIVLNKIARYLLDDFRSFRRNFYLALFSA